MAAARRFGARSEIVSHLPAGAVLELSAPSVPDELVERVLAGEVATSLAAIRREKATERTSGRSYEVGGTFIDYIERFNGDMRDVAAGIAAHELRRWREPDYRAWLVRCLRDAADMVDRNIDDSIPRFELPRSTVRRLLQQPD
jgi:hypothetical protein